MVVVSSVSEPVPLNKMPPPLEPMKLGLPPVISIYFNVTLLLPLIVITLVVVSPAPLIVSCGDVGVAVATSDVPENPVVPLVPQLLVVPIKVSDLSVIVRCSVHECSLEMTIVGAQVAIVDTSV